MYYQILTCSIFLLSSVYSLSDAKAQDQMDLARVYPPEYVQNHDVALQQMEWQLKHLELRKVHQSHLGDTISEQLTELDRNSKKLADKLPIELRYANDDVRAKLVGDCLRELLAYRLEIAGHEELLAQLNKKMATANEESVVVTDLEKKKRQLAVESVLQRLQQAQSEYDHAQELFKKSFVPKQEVERAKFAVKIVENELVQAELEMKIVDNAKANEVSERLVEARIELQPLRARVTAAENFLKLFSDSEDTFSKIAELERQRQLLYDEQQVVSQTLRSLEEQIIELQTLYELNRSAPGPKSAAGDKQFP